MKKLGGASGFALIVTFVVVNGCYDNGPYVPTGPHFLIQRDIAEDGTVTQSIKVDLFTGDLNQYDELTDGAMRVNGEPMKLGREEHDLPYYFVETPTISANTEYTFEITLSDGRIATAAVITQKTFVSALYTPASVDVQSNMDISWSGGLEDDYLVLGVSYIDKAKGEILIYTAKLKPEDIAAGSFTVDKNSFYRPPVNTVIIRLSSFKMGTATNFLDGGRIMSKMTVERVVSLD